MKQLILASLILSYAQTRGEDDTCRLSATEVSSYRNCNKLCNLTFQMDFNGTVLDKMVAKAALDTCQYKCTDDALDQAEERLKKKCGIIETEQFRNL